MARIVDVSGHCHSAAAPDKAYFIEEMIPRSAEIVFIGGQSGAGKTFIAVHLGVCLASGVPFFGRAVERRTGTVILAAEGAGTIKNRLRVARKQWVGDEPLPIAFRPQVVSLTNPVSVDELIRQLGRCLDTFAVGSASSLAPLCLTLSPRHSS